MSQSYDTENLAILERSLKQLGQIYSVIIDSDGEVLAGRHRLKAGATKKVTIDTQKIAERLGISRKMAKLMIILHSNVQRRVSKEETRELILEMARELEAQGVPKEKIAAELYKKYVPYSERYIRELLPDEYKQVEKRNISDIQNISKTTHAELVPHSQMSNENLTDVNDDEFSMEEVSVEGITEEQFRAIVELREKLLGRPLDKTEKEFLKTLTKSEAEQMIRELQQQIRLFRVTRTERDIKMQMHSPISRVDVEVPMRLNQLGIHDFVTQQPITVYQLIPDIMFPDKRIMVFFDGPGHKHDDLEYMMREAMRRRGWTVLELPYKQYSKQTVEELVKEILLALGQEVKIINA